MFTLPADSAALTGGSRAPRCERCPGFHARITNQAIDGGLGGGDAVTNRSTGPADRDVFATPGIDPIL